MSKIALRRSMRARILTIVLGSIGILTLVNVLISGWGLVRVRDRAASNSSQTLQQRAESYLLDLAQERATRTSQTIAIIQQIAAGTASYMAHAAAGRPIAAADLKTTPQGRRYYQGRAMVVLPTNGDEQQLLEQLGASQCLEWLLPEVGRQLPEVVRISYLASNGIIRTFPNLNPSDLARGWMAQGNQIYQASLPENNPRRAVVWTEVHPGINGSEPVISAVAPVYLDGQFSGAVVVDVSLSRLTIYLKQLSVTQTGFAFLIDAHGHLIAAPEEAQQHLLGRVMSRAEQGTITLPESNPKLKAVLVDMRASRSGLATVDLGDRPSILTYAPIAGVDWSLGLAAPLDEITAATSETKAQIESITSEAQRLGLVGPLAAVVLLGLVISYVLRVQFARPLTALMGATEAIAAGNLHRIAVKNDDEMGRLATSFNKMADQIESSRTEIIATNQRLEQTVRERSADLEQSVIRLEQAFATQQELLRMLREVSTPVIPVIDGVLAMPLIGQLDAERAKNATRSLLSRIERDHSNIVLLDITGVPMIDISVAEALMQTVAASRLLGAEVILVGITAEVAQTLVAIGIDLRGLRTAATMQSAIEQILLRRRVRLSTA